MERALVMFPDSPLTTIEGFRRRYDPNVGLIDAHLTLVFPFTSDISTPVLEGHVRSIACNAAPIGATVTVPHSWDGDFLGFGVGAGSEEIVRLHRALYTGVLASFRSPDRLFTPHITIARTASPDVQREALEAARSTLGPFATHFRTVSAFSITNRVTEFSVALGK